MRHRGIQSAWADRKSTHWPAVALTAGEPNPERREDLMTVEPLTRAELREELDRSLRHYATKADLANLKFALAAWMLLLVSAATGILIAVDRLAGPGTGG